MTTRTRTAWLAKSAVPIWLMVAMGTTLIVGWTGMAIYALFG